jgi:sulfate transport system permease protein
MLLIPLSVIFWDGLQSGLTGLWAEVTRPTAWAALKLTLWTAAVMVAINTVMGTLMAYVLVRYDFPPGYPAGHLAAHYQRRPVEFCPRHR